MKSLIIVFYLKALDLLPKALRCLLKALNLLPKGFLSLRLLDELLLTPGAAGMEKGAGLCQDQPLALPGPLSRSQSEEEAPLPFSLGCSRHSLLSDPWLCLLPLHRLAPKIYSFQNHAKLEQ